MRFALVYLFLLTGLVCQSSNPESTPKAATPTEEAIVQRHHASVAPEGAQIVYHAHRPNGRVGLYLANADGSNERPLFTPDDAHAQEPRWSPTGDWIAFVGGPDREPGSFALQVIRPDGTGQRVVARSADAQIKSPSWHPDGSALAFEVRRREAGSSHVHVIRLDGTGERIVTDGHEGMNQMPRWSPDGSRVLVAWRDADYTQGDLYLLPLEDDAFTPGEKRWITQNPLVENMPAWTPDGQAILYVAPPTDDALNEVFAVDVASGAVRQLTHTPALDEFFPAASPDGRWVYMDAFTDADGTNRSSIVRLPLE